MSGTGKVSVGKSVLVGLGALTATALLAVAFLLGRLSGNGRPTDGPPAVTLVAAPVPSPRATEPAPPTSVPVIDSIGPQTLVPPAPQPTSSPTAGIEPRPSPATSAVPTAADRREPAASDATRAAVATYLDAIDHIQPGKLDGDAEGMANELAGALAKGDASGLDKLIQETEAARAKLAALTPPAPAAGHYRESLGAVDDALEMLRSLKAAMASGDPASHLARVAGQATALRARSEALQKEEQALRQRFGLTR